MANTYLTRTQSMGNRTTFTFSAWVKRSSLGEQYLINAGASGTSRTQFHFNGDNALMFYNNDGGSVNMYIKTNRLFRDLSAWYHIVLRFDTTQSTASDRIRFYVNGEEETSLATNTIPSQNADNTQFNYNGVVADIGRRHYDASNYFDGSMSHVHFCDGQSYDATAFGEYDANGVWKIKTSPSVTYGTNGFFILKNGNSVTDQSGEGNNWTVGGGTLTNTEDSPSNVFATLNAIRPLPTGFSLSNGNTKFSTASGSDTGNVNSTILANQGKFYAECKLAGGAEKEGIGAIGENELPANHFGNGTQNILFNADIPAVFINGTQTNVSGVTPANGDILGMALDLDNGRAYFHVNGTYINSGNPSTETGFYSFTVGSVYWGIGSADGSSLTGSAEMNYGNGYFGTTAVSSAGTNASGNGIFEFDVPTGYTALSTKGLNL